MAEVIERPLFAEGEILRAEDLNATIDQSRARDARHSRQAHRWGIVIGLELVGNSSSGGFEINLRGGVARDIRGREIVVPADEVLSPDDFHVTGGEKDWFPVFLLGVDEIASGTSLGVCGDIAGRRTRERYEVQFGRPQEAIDWEEQDEPEVDEGPDLPTGGTAARVLLGFVQWDSNKNNFTAVEAFSPAGIKRRYAGVRGGAFESPDGKILALVAGAEKDAIAVHVDGGSNPVFRLDRQGNLSIQGTLESALKGDVKVSSGVASDGVKLPLPSGVKEEDVGKKLALHIFLRPLIEMALIPVECSVDDQRRLRCQVREVFDTVAPPNLQWKTARTWPAEYLVVVGPKGAT